MYRFNSRKTMGWNITNSLCAIIVCISCYVVNDANASPLFGKTPKEINAPKEQDNLLEQYNISPHVQPTGGNIPIEELFQEPEFNPMKKDEKLQGYEEIMDLGEPDLESQLQRSYRSGRTSASECIEKGFCRNWSLQSDYCESTCKRIHSSETSLAFYDCKLECDFCRQLHCG